MKNIQELLQACGIVGDSALTTEFKPIDIELKVVPIGIDFNESGPVVAFRVLIDDKLEADGPMLRQTEYEVEFGLPIEAVNLVSH